MYPTPSPGSKLAEGSSTVGKSPARWTSSIKFSTRTRFWAKRVSPSPSLRGWKCLMPSRALKTRISRSPRSCPTGQVSSVRCGTRESCVIRRSNQDPSLPSGKSSWSPITSLFGHRLSGGSISVSFATTRKAPGNCLPFGWSGLTAGRSKQVSANPFSPFTKSFVGTA